jgi:hypothetical protein
MTVIRGKYVVTPEMMSYYPSLDPNTNPLLKAAYGTVLNEALNKHPNTTASDWDISHYETIDPMTLNSEINVTCEMKPAPTHININWNVEGPVSNRNQLTQRQTQALIKLWDKWYSHGDLELSRLAYSPYSENPHIIIERRDDLIDKQSDWDWCIAFFRDGNNSQYAADLFWYSNSKEPMPDEIRTFLRMAYDKEFMSIPPKTKRLTKQFYY